MNTSIQSILIVLTLLFSGLLPKAQAVVPPPDGGYPGFNTAEGENALLSVTTGTYNTAIGFLSLQEVTSGELNTGVGAATLVLNNGDNNTAIGAGALLNNFTGKENTATGRFALIRNTQSDANTANGANTLAFNTTGSENTATGANALHNNTADRNTANGSNALFANTQGIANTAMGNHALFANTTGIANTAMGNNALVTSTDGSANTAVGNDTLHHNTGDNNTAVGNRALGTNTDGTGNTAVGSFALLNSAGDGNTCVGDFAGRDLTTGSYNIYIGFGIRSVADESNTIRIGNSASATFIKGISGATVAGGAAVFVTSNGQLGTATSSRRFKDKIEPMGNASEAILALRPVSFHYKKDIDPQGIPEFGLVAEEVEKVNPALVIRDTEGKPYTVRYEQVNAMLLNEFLKEHRAFVEQQRKVERLEKQVAALTAGLEKVSAKVDARPFLADLR